MTKKKETGEAETKAETKQRTVRPIYVLLPKEQGLYEVHKCVGFEEVRSVLEKQGADESEDALSKVLLLRGDQIPLVVQKQTKIKFGNR